MIPKKTDWAEVWKDLDDYLAPLLAMKPPERALYFHLLRHTRLAGWRVTGFRLAALSLALRLTPPSVLRNLNKLTRKGCLRRRWNWRNRLDVEVFLPREIVRRLTPRAWRARICSSRNLVRLPAVRQAILRRERGRCFYCRTSLRPPDRQHLVWFDHVIPLSHGGAPNEQNVVACCMFCNRQKGRARVQGFLREMLLLKRLSLHQYRQRLALVLRIQRGEPILPIVLRGRKVVVTRPPARAACLASPSALRRKNGRPAGRPKVAR
jgi:5-methylcytosine-specific restriction endonuclease McrA